MEAFFVHLIKSCLVLTLFLGAYILFLKKETFFNGNRLFLGMGVLISILLPFFEITQIVYVARAPLSLLENTSEILPLASQNTAVFLEPLSVLALVYAFGVLFLFLRLLFQLLRIWHIRRQSDVQRKDSFYHVKTPLRISPFSFFKHIFYHPGQFEKTELQLIIAHEKVHAKELHSLDILLIELLVIIQWFNPFAWYYAAVVKQNLEFVADTKTCAKQINKKQYQYLMLQQALTHQNLSIVNPFFNSLTQLSIFGKKLPVALPGGQIKKRILMLHQKPSQKKNYVKLLFVLPLLAAFLLAFNTKKEVRYAEENIPSTIAQAPNFTAPLQQKDIKRISSHFGEVQAGIAKGKLHKGIDLVAKEGTTVMASAPGKVSASSFNPTNGNYVIVDHGNGYLTKYLHLQQNEVIANQNVASGATLGYVGNTGVSSGPHLHFEIVRDNSSLDPESFVAFATTTGKPNTSNANPLPSKPIASGKSIELVITKETTDAQLEQMKTDLAEDGVDFSYTVVHNADKEIKEINFQLSGKSANGGTFNNSYTSAMQGGVIKPIVIYIDLENNLVSVGSKNQKQLHNSNTTVWVQEGAEEHEEIIIKKVNGEKKLFIDGEEVEMDALAGHQIKLHMDEDDDSSKTKLKIITSEKSTKKRKKGKSSSEVIILKDADNDDDSNIEISTENQSQVFIRTDGDKKPLIYIDGVEASPEEMSKLSANKIKSMNVFKGKAARKKYGKKGKDGVVQITTKEK